MSTACANVLIFRVATILENLENLEKSGNFIFPKKVREMSGNLTKNSKVREKSGNLFLFTFQKNFKINFSHLREVHFKIFSNYGVWLENAIISY